MIRDDLWAKSSLCLESLWPGSCRSREGTTTARPKVEVVFSWRYRSMGHELLVLGELSRLTTASLVRFWGTSLKGSRLLPGFLSMWSRFH